MAISPLLGGETDGVTGMNAESDNRLVIVRAALQRQTEKLGLDLRQTFGMCVIALYDYAAEC